MNYGILTAKAKALTTEARQLRKEIQKTGRRISYANREQQNYDPFTNCLSAQQRAKFKVRQEARAVHLARAMLKGVPYKAVENHTNPYTTPVAIERLQELTGWTASKIGAWASYDYDLELDQALEEMSRFFADFEVALGEGEKV